jgi:hypothetical protein
MGDMTDMCMMNEWEAQFYDYYEADFSPDEWAVYIFQDFRAPDLSDDFPDKLE